MSDSAKPNDMPLWGARARVLVPGVVAWLITVGEPARQSGSPSAARVVGVLSLVCLFAGAGLVTLRPALGRALALHGFVLSALLSWALFGGVLSSDRIDRGRALFGALSWLLFAFGWGRARPVSSDRDDPHVVPGPTLQPRSRLPWLSIGIGAVATLFALLLSALAFRVERPDHALFGHAAAIACGLLLLGVGGRIALVQGQRFDLGSPGSRLDAVSVPGALIGVLVGLGLVWAAIR